MARGREASRVTTSIYRLLTKDGLAGCPTTPSLCNGSTRYRSTWPAGRSSDNSGGEISSRAAVPLAPTGNSLNRQSSALYCASVFVFLHYIHNALRLSRSVPEFFCSFKALKSSGGQAFRSRRTLGQLACGQPRFSANFCIFPLTFP